MAMSQVVSTKALLVPKDERKTKEQLRQQILRAANVLIAESGYDELTIRKIAERVSCPPMALYHHFANKKMILIALAQEGFAEIAATLPRPGKDPWHTLQQAMMRYIEFGLDHPIEYGLVFSIQRFNNALKATEQTIGAVSNRAGGQHAFRRMLEYVDANLNGGVLKGDRFTITIVLWAGVHGCVSLLLTQDRTVTGPPEAFAAAIVTTLLRGVGAF